MSEFNWVDVVTAAIVLLSAFFAFYRGFLREALAIGGWIGAAAAAWYGHDDAKAWLEPWIPNENLLNAAAAGAVFLAALAVFWVIIHFVVARVRNSPLGALDRSLGFLFGVARGAAVVALLFLLGKYTFWDERGGEPPGWLANAASYTLIAWSAEMIERAIPEDLPGLSAGPAPDAPFGGADADPERLAQPPVAGEAADSDSGPVYEDDPMRLLDAPPGAGEALDGPDAAAGADAGD